MNNQSNEINELAIALAKCQGEMESAKKDSDNPFFKSKYADLSSVWATCRIPLTKNGLSIAQTLETINDKLHLNTLLLHSSGQWIKSTMPIISAKQDAQGMGSGITYARRYCLSAIIGISQDDDDGEAAVDRNKANRKVADIIPIIGTAKVKQLIELSDQCDNSYMEKLFSYLASLGIKDFSMIKEDMFPKILKGMMANAQANEKEVET